MFELLHRHTNKGEDTKETRIFIPAAKNVNIKTTKRFAKTFFKMMGSSGAVTVVKLIGMVGLPCICILFNITFFIIGMAG